MTNLNQLKNGQRISLNNPIHVSANRCNVLFEYHLFVVNCKLKSHFKEDKQYVPNKSMKNNMQIWWETCGGMLTEITYVFFFKCCVPIYSVKGSVDLGFSILYNYEPNPSIDHTAPYPFL